MEIHYLLWESGCVEEEVQGRKGRKEEEWEEGGKENVKKSGYETMGDIPMVVQKNNPDLFFSYQIKKKEEKGSNVAGRIWKIHRSVPKPEKRKACDKDA